MINHVGNTKERYKADKKYHAKLALEIKHYSNIINRNFHIVQNNYKNA